MMNQMLPEISLSDILNAAHKKETELKEDFFKSYSTLIQFFPWNQQRTLNRFLQEPRLAPDGV